MMNILRAWYEYYLRSDYGDRVGIILASMIVMFAAISVLGSMVVVIYNAPIVSLVIALVIAAVLFLARLPRRPQR